MPRIIPLCFDVQDAESSTLIRCWLQMNHSKMVKEQAVVKRRILLFRYKRPTSTRWVSTRVLNHVRLFHAHPYSQILSPFIPCLSIKILSIALADLHHLRLIAPRKANKPLRIVAAQKRHPTTVKQTSIRTPEQAHNNNLHTLHALYRRILF
jgi:hypothetical protein